ncbi:unnamed protein product, partial [marine sediment metagenome]
HGHQRTHEEELLSFVGGEGHLRLADSEQIPVESDDGIQGSICRLELDVEHAPGKATVMAVIRTSKGQWTRPLSVLTPQREMTWPNRIQTIRDEIAWNEMDTLVRAREAARDRSEP